MPRCSVKNNEQTPVAIVVQSAQLGRAHLWLHDRQWYEHAWLPSKGLRKLASTCENKDESSVFLWREEEDASLCRAASMIPANTACNLSRRALSKDAVTASALSLSWTVFISNKKNSWAS